MNINSIEYFKQESKNYVPNIDNNIQEILNEMFYKIQEPFKRHRPKDRINFLSYSYVLHKFFQLLELNDYLKYCPLFKYKKNLINHDKIWKKICYDCDWPFYPSL